MTTLSIMMDGGMSVACGAWCHTPPIKHVDNMHEGGVLGQQSKIEPHSLIVVVPLEKVVGGDGGGVLVAGCELLRQESYQQV